jgi:hypothetical protein
MGCDFRIFINTGRSLVFLSGSGTNADYVIAKDYQTGDFGLDIFDPAKFAAQAKAHYEAHKYGYNHERFILTPYLDFLKTASALEKQADQPDRAGRSDLLQVLDAPTQITGTQDIDFLQGTAGNDVIVGGGELDLLLAGAGSDIYRYAAGDGDDYIVDYDGDADDVDVLAFDDLNIGDIELRGSGSTDLYIRVLGTQPSTITITNQFAEGGLEGIEEIHFADGKVLNRAQIVEALQTVRGTNGDDELHAKSQQINGEWQPTIFVGGHGNDQLYGGYNGDTYVYAKGDGNDTIQDLADGIGTLDLSDLNPDDISVSRLSDNSIVITIGDTGETITVKPYSSQTIGFNQIVFANETTWNRDDILAATHAPHGATLMGDAVAENAINGTVVGTVAGVDPDADAVLTYTFTNDAGGRFAIDATTGQITVADGTLLDYETATSHSVVVRVTDQTGLKFDKAFILNVTDVDETSSNLGQYNGSGVLLQPVEVKTPDAVHVASSDLGVAVPSWTFTDASAVNSQSNFTWKDGHVSAAPDVSIARQLDGAASDRGIGTAFHFVDMLNAGPSGEGEEISYTFIEDGFPAARSDGPVLAGAAGAWPLSGIEVQDALAKSSWLAVSQDWHVT